ncbi:hypothetical protein [Cryobacterium zhongshanensis]|uniref:Tfp pilus assembly protein PilO n=1 Tax=Cryobacterium zhongshanensis TaxID=2928153 RepID=A0AA41QTQ5_9MICO|nr:hypothetical protein [Cryobacterium zhongshanensis]MCI4656464.1 hypothetical protein [Cryobacterium zhongshanensis]
MDKNRIWIIGSVVIMVAVLAMGLLLGIQPQLAAVATADQARVAVEASNAGQAAVLAKLQSDYAGIDALKAELIPLRASVPSGTEMPSFVTQLDALAGSTSVTLTGMTVSDAVPYAAPAALAATGTTDAAATPAAVMPLTNAQITATTFASLAVSITVTGSYAHALDFISGLQSGQRLFLVTGINTAPVAEDATADAKKSATGDITATITGLVYVLVPPATAGTPAATTAATPTPTPTPAAK